MWFGVWSLEMGVVLNEFEGVLEIHFTKLATMN